MILYYSSYGHIETMASAIAEGVADTAGVEAVVKRVPELMPREVAENAGVKLDQAAPFAEPGELGDYDGLIVGSPTRFGNMAAQMRNFLDQTGPLWAKGALIGKVGAAFTSTASQHGGQETTLVSIHTTMHHHGMVVVGIPYSEVRLSQLDEVSGGTPYGATTIAGLRGERQPTENELAIARTQGRFVAQITKQLAAGRAAAG